MNWYFLLGWSIVIITWVIASNLYKKSAWLHTNKPVSIKITRLPKVDRFIEKALNLDNEIVNILAGLMVLVPILTMILLAGLFVKGGFNELEFFISTKPWWGKTLIGVCCILFYYGVRIWWDGRKWKSFLRAKKEDESSYSSRRIAKKVYEINALKIPTYPRLTVFDMTVQERDDKVIFDSSDIVVISEALELNEKYMSSTILEGSQLFLDNKRYFIKRVQIEFLNFFDDYSLLEHVYGRRHTKIYKGRDVPYNVQMTIDVIPNNA